MPILDVELPERLRYLNEASWLRGGVWLLEGNRGFLKLDTAQLRTHSQFYLDSFDLTEGL